MTSAKGKFITDSDKVSFDVKHRRTVNFNISRYDSAVDNCRASYSNFELARQRGSFIKEHAVNNLHDYLLQFEKVITARGVKVIWAETGYEAVEAVKGIVCEYDARLVVKSKSMTTEEIDFNEHAANAGFESLETDLGEYIVQVAGEKPYHIVTPAMHKSKEDIARLFHEKFGIPEHSTPEYIAAYVRRSLREKFQKADIGITGANFLIADTGSIALTENEGNAMMSFSFPKVHVVIAGIEKIIPSMKDLGYLWPLLAAQGTGQRVTSYNSIVSGARREGEPDGPEKMYVILLDNKRSELYDKDDRYLALKCIRCGACLNACPIYKNVGGYTYASTYSGPIGSVITPFFRGLGEYNHLSSACSVCGRCTEVCPVKIPIHKMLLYNRRDAINGGYGTMMWNLGIQAYEYACMKRKRLDLVGGNVKNKLGAAGKNALGEHKALPVFADKSFSRLWKKPKN